jgi:hypothetical protein
VDVTEVAGTDDTAAVEAYPVKAAVDAAKTAAEAAAPKDGTVSFAIESSISSDAKLSPAFDAKVTDYTLTVKSATDSTQNKVTAGMITVTGGKTDESENVDPVVDGNKITVTSENAKNGGEEVTYTITVVFANDAAPVVNVNGTAVVWSSYAASVTVNADDTVADLKSVIKLADDAANKDKNAGATLTYKLVAESINPNKAVADTAKAKDVKIVVTTEYGTEYTINFTTEAAESKDADPGT